MNNRFIAQLIVVVASVILGMIIYPWLRRKFVRLIEKIYLQTRNDRPVDEFQRPASAKKSRPIKAETPSIVGKSKWEPGHRGTKAASDLESENPKEKEHIFAPESGEESPLMDMDYPLEKEEAEGEVNLDEEETELSVENDADCASGASYEELMHTNRTIVNEEAPKEDKEEAGRVLYENEKTEMFQQVVASSEETASVITSLIDVHLAMRAERLRKEQEVTYPDDLKDFDINSIF